MADRAAYPLPLQKMYARDLRLCVIFGVISAIIACGLAIAAIVGG